MTDSERVGWLLHDLVVQCGYSMAIRQPEHFEHLVPLGPVAFAHAVLVAEGLVPEHEKALRTALERFVTARFERWAEDGS